MRRCCAWRVTALSTPVAESRLSYDAKRAEVRLASGTSDGPYAGVHRMAALERIARWARWLDHVPERYETRVRYYGAYATRRRVGWRGRGVVLVDAPRVEPRCARARGRLAGAARAAATLKPNCGSACSRSMWKCARTRLRRVPRGGTMPIVGFATESAMVRRIFAQLEHGGIDARQTVGGCRGDPGLTRARRGATQVAAPVKLPTRDACSPQGHCAH